MKNIPPFRRRFELGFIASMALALAAFEWTATEYLSPVAWVHSSGTLLESEVAPSHTPPKPSPPPRLWNMSPNIHPDPPKSTPMPPAHPNPDPLLGKLHAFDGSDWGDGGDEEDDVETLLVAEHMPHFSDCTNVLDRDAEQICTEQTLISLIQDCAKFPAVLREAGVGGVVYLQFIVNEFGVIQDAQTLKSAHPKLDRAAMEALNCIPRMEPGTQQGRPVRVSYTLPVRFTVR